jgi:2'-5' RNA ligase
VSLFVAVVPSAAAVDDLEHALHVARAQRLPRDLRWQPAGRWHITMAFLGDPDDDADDVVAARLDSIAAMTVPPDLRLAGAGCFGRQVLWMGVTGTTADDDAAFAALGATIRAGLRADRFTLERRPWHPHLTVGRTRGGDARPVVPLLESYTGPAWQAGELMAVRSEGGPTPRHVIVHRVRLPFSRPVGDRDA